MRTNTRNIRIAAINNGTEDGFNIYLDFSGQREFLMHHRHNGLLFALLNDGIRADDLRRWSPANGRGSRSRASGDKLKSMVAHLLIVVEDYIAEREYYATGSEAAWAPAYAGAEKAGDSYAA